MRARDLALSSIFTALYAVLVLVLAGVSFQIVQVRIADALIPLVIVFGWPAIVGVTLGAAVANFASPLPSVLTDVTLGSIANLVASLLVWKISRLKLPRKTLSELLSCIAATVTITFFVGTYLALLTQTEPWLWWLGIGVGSIISIDFIGFPLLQVTKRINLRQVAT